MLNGAFLPRLQCTSISNAATLELLHQLWWVRYWELSQCVTLIPCSCSYSNVYFSLPVRNFSGCLLSISVLLANDWNPIANQYISEKRLMHLSNCWNHDRASSACLSAAGNISKTRVSFPPEHVYCSCKFMNWICKLQKLVILNLNKKNK